MTCLRIFSVRAYISSGARWRYAAFFFRHRSTALATLQIIRALSCGSNVFIGKISSPACRGKA